MAATHFDPSEYGFHLGTFVVKDEGGYGHKAVVRIGVTKEEDGHLMMLTRTYLTREEVQQAIEEMAKLTYKDDTLTEEELHVLDHFAEAYTLCRIRGDESLMLQAVQSREGLNAVRDQIVGDFQSILFRLALLVKADAHVK